METRVYLPLDEYSDIQVQHILTQGTAEELMQLPLSVGMYCSDWRKAQDICIRLFQHKEAAIRANAALGLSYIARTKFKLEKRIVKPYLLKELRENKEYQWRIIDAIKDINLFMGWHLAQKNISQIEK